MGNERASRGIRELVRARLNLLAVLPNLEDVVRDDAEMGALVAGADLTVRFVVANGPHASVRFARGVCTVEEGDLPLPRRRSDGDPHSVVLGFASPAHLNRMFDGRSTPVPLWGFTHLGFLRGGFTTLTDRLAYYLTPGDGLLDHEGYLAMNTKLTLQTAAFAVPQLLACDPDCRHLRHALRSGTVVLRVLPDGPAVSLVFEGDDVHVLKHAVLSPDALVLLPGLRVANDFLNGRMDTFAAVARGDVQIWGQVGMVDALSLVLDRVPSYLQPAAQPAAAKAG